MPCWRHTARLLQRRLEAFLGWLALVHDSFLFTAVAKPLRPIYSRGYLFYEGSGLEESFLELKQHLPSAPVLAYFDKDPHTPVIADASFVWRGMVLVQEKNGGQGRSQAFLPFKPRKLMD